MPHPTWLAYGLAVIMVSVSVYCIGRLLVAKRWDRRNHNDVNTSHILTGLAMAGMLVPRWNLVPDALWEVTFGLIALWFAALSVRFVTRHGLRGADEDHVHHNSHYLIHMVMACAMLYMYWLGAPAFSSSGSIAMSGPSVGAGDPSLTLLFIVVLFARPSGSSTRSNSSPPDSWRWWPPATTARPRCRTGKHRGGSPHGSRLAATSRYASRWATCSC